VSQADSDSPNTGAEARQRLTQLVAQLRQDQAELSDAQNTLDEQSLADGKQAVAAVIRAVENLDATLPKG
jgi:hypothetical protein